MLQGRNKKTVIISFGLGKYVAVNAIIRKLTLKKWRANTDFDEYFWVSKQLNTKFALKCRIAKSGMPVTVKLNNKYFSVLLC